MTLQFIIEGRRWFNKGSGNTYHSVTITDAVTGDHIARCDYAYGYGSCYEQTALELLVSEGLIPKLEGHKESGISKQWGDFVDNYQREGKIRSTVVDVNRKKHL